MTKTVVAAMATGTAVTITAVAMVTAMAAGVQLLVRARPCKDVGHWGGGDDLSPLLWFLCSAHCALWYLCPPLVKG
jgi:hypothetical protein